MADDSNLMTLDTNSKMHRVKVDWTLNVTTLAAFGIGCATAAGLFYGLDKRISRQEEMAPIEAAARKEKDAEVNRKLNELVVNLSEVKTAVDKVGRTIDVQNEVRKELAGTREGKTK